MPSLSIKNRRRAAEIGLSPDTVLPASILVLSMVDDVEAELNFVKVRPNRSFVI